MLLKNHYFFRLFLLFCFLFNSNLIISKEKKSSIKKGKGTREVVFYVKKNLESNEYIARKGILADRKAPATILVLHGYGRDKFDVGPFSLFLKDFNCMSFDFRAHGENKEDQLSTVGSDEILDVFAAVDYLRSLEDFKNKPLFVFAHSMGAATAIEAQAQYNDFKEQYSAIKEANTPNLFEAMFLDAPFSSSKDVLRRGMEKVKLGLFGYEFYIPGTGWLQEYAFNPYVQPLIMFLLKGAGMSSPIQTFVKPIEPVESIKEVTVPCYFVVCKNDAKITVEAVTEIFNNAAGYKRLWITGGRDHCDSVFSDPERYMYTVNAFFKSVLNKTIFKQPKSLVTRSPD